MKVHLNGAIAWGPRVAASEIEDAFVVVAVEAFERDLSSARGRSPRCQFPGPDGPLVQFVVEAAVAPSGYDKRRLLFRRHAVDLGDELPFAVQKPQAVVVEKKDALRPRVVVSALGQSLQSDGHRSVFRPLCRRLLRFEISDTSFEERREKCQEGQEGQRVGCCLHRRIVSPG